MTYCLLGTRLRMETLDPGVFLHSGGYEGWASLGNTIH